VKKPENMWKNIRLEIIVPTSVYKVVEDEYCALASQEVKDKS
jgi:hypothetical protein